MITKKELQNSRNNISVVAILAIGLLVFASLTVINQSVIIEDLKYNLNKSMTLLVKANEGYDESIILTKDFANLTESCVSKLKSHESYIAEANDVVMMCTNQLSQYKAKYGNMEANGFMRLK